MLRRADRCVDCGTGLDAGVRARWDSGSRTVTCLACAAMPVEAVSALDAVPAAVAEASPVEEGAPVRASAGGSAQREYERRVQQRQERVRDRHPRIGGLLLALVDDPTSTKVWAQGAVGERAVGAKLTELEGEHLVVLHDRRMLRPDGRPSRANIDHVAVAANGVWVVDAKTHRGRLEVRRTGGILRPVTERLSIRGRDQTALVEGVQRQVDAVRRVLTEAGADVPVRGVLCFVGTELPWLDESIGGVPLRGRRGLAKLLKRPGPLTAEAREALARVLEERFVPA